MQTDPTDSTADWKQVAPVLDDALNKLGEADRAVIFLRFFEKKTASDIAAALSLSEEAAQKRVSRALDRLRGMLSGQGAGVSTMTLASLIAAEAVVATPIGLSTSVSSAALAGGGLTATTFKLVLMSKLKIGAASALLIAAVATPLVMQHRQLIRLRDENQSLQEQKRQATDLRSENERLSAQLAQSKQPPGLSDAERAELLRLRGEVGPLRRDSQELVRLRAQPPPVKPVAAPADEAVQRFDAQRARTVNALKIVGLQLRMLENADNLKSAFAADGSLDPNLVAESLPNFDMKQVEFLLKDPSQLSKILAESPQTVIARTADPIPTPDGKWLRVYTLADGSVQQRSTENPNEAFDGNWQLVQVKPKQ